MYTFNLTNEIINYISEGCRADLVHKKGTAAKAKFVFVNYSTAITAATAKVLYQNDGELLVDLPVTVDSVNSITIDVPFFLLDKPLNYWIEVKNQDDENLFYGAFTLI